MIALELTSRDIYQTIRNGPSYQRLTGASMAKLVKFCNKINSFYPFWRYEGSIKCIEIEPSLMHDVLYDLDMKVEKDILNESMLETLCQLPVWNRTETIYIHSDFYDWHYEIRGCEQPLIRFLSDKSIHFARLKKLIIHGYYDFDSTLLIDRYPCLEAINCHIQHSIHYSPIISIPKQLTSFHGGIWSSNSLMNAFNIHDKLEELCLYRDIERTSFDGYDLYQTVNGHYKRLTNLRRLRITSWTTDDSSGNSRDEILKKLLYQFGGLKKLNYIEFYGYDNFFPFLNDLLLTYRDSIILRYNWSGIYGTINNNTLKSNINAFVERVNKNTKNWILIFADVQQIDINDYVIHTFPKLTNIWYITNNYSKYKDIYSNDATKWTMECHHVHQKNRLNI